MAAALDNMARRETLAKARWHDGSSYERESHLAAVRVTRQRERDPRRNIGKDVRVVAQEKNRGSVQRHRSKGRRQVVPSGPEIADSRNPDRAARGLDARGGLFKNWNACPLEGASNAVMVKPAVMVAENGNDAGGRTEVRELSGNDFRRDEAPSNDPLDHQVPENADEIPTGGVGARHRLVKFSHSVEWGPDVKIGQDGDAQTTRRWPREVEMLLLDTKAGWLQPDGPRSQQECGASRDAGHEPQRRPGPS